MGEIGSITRGWKEEVSCTREDTFSFHPRVMEPLSPHIQSLKVDPPCRNVTSYAIVALAIYDIHDIFVVMLLYFFYDSP